MVRVRNPHFLRLRHPGVGRCRDCCLTRPIVSFVR
jgi:hypothetical protein